MLAAYPMQLPPELHADIDTRFPGFLTKYAEKYENTRRIYGHVSVGGWCGLETAYHRLVKRTGAGKFVITSPTNTPLTTDLYGHTDGRNTGSLALCMDCLDATATTTNFGNQPPTADEHAAFIQLSIDVCNDLACPVSVMMLHAEAGNNLDFPTPDDPAVPAWPAYGPGAKRGMWRWDGHYSIWVATGIPVDDLFDGGTAKYPQHLLPPEGSGYFELWTPPPGRLYFGDYWRWKTLEGIAVSTKGKLW